MRVGSVEISPDLHRAHINASRVATSLSREIHEATEAKVTARLHNRHATPAAAETRRKSVVLGAELIEAAQMGVLRVPSMAAVQALMHTQHIHSYQPQAQSYGAIDISF